MKIAIGILLIFLHSISGEAQTFHGGIFMGFSASQVDGDSYAGYDKFGLQGGVFISTALSNHFDARMEIRYAARGARNPASEDNTGEYQLGLHYIDIPLFIAAHVKQIGSVEFGLIPGYLFALRGEDDAGVLPEEYLVDFHKFDLGLLLGVNFRISQKVAVNFRYSYSILSIRDQEDAGSYYSWFGKLFGHSSGDFNNYLTLGVNYLIR